MSLENKWDEDKYKIAATLTECLLFEYDIVKETVNIFHGYEKLLETDSVLTDIKYEKDERIVQGIHPDDRTRFFQLYEELNIGSEKLHTEIRVINKEGVYMWVEVFGQVFYDDADQPVMILGRLSNIDARKKETEKFKNKSEKDALTQLFNRETTEKLINRILRSDDLVEGALLLIDFDNFKALNDSLGYLFGDSVLKNVSAHMKKAFRSTDIVGRVGGDKFVVFLSGQNIQKLVIDKADMIRSVFRSVYNMGDDENLTSCSIGIAIAPKDGKNYYELFKAADFALYQAKTSGKNCYCIYDDRAHEENLFTDGPLMNRYEITETHHQTDKHNADVTANRILELLFSAKDIHNAINMILAMVGEKYNVCNVYICELDDNHNFNATYEWNRDGVNIKKERIRDIPLELIDYYFDMFDIDGVFYCSNTEELKEIHPTIYSLLNGQEVKSTLQCYILDMGEFKGYVGFDEFNSSRMWTKAEIEALTIIAKIVGTYITQLRTKERLEEERMMLKEISKNQNIFSYILKPNSFELIYFDDNTRDMFPDAKVGALCYKVIMNSQEPCIECPLYHINDEDQSNNIIYIYNSAKNMRLKVTATKICWGKKTANLICASEVTDFVKMIKEKDDFTGLPTLARFERELEQRITETKKRVVILTIDIDKFKNINESLGYMVGNEVLKAFVKEMTGYLYENEIFCRSTADKFLILLNYDNYENIYMRINNMLETVSYNLNRTFEEINVVLAAGLYITNEDDTSAAHAIDRADIARKSIKGAHKSVFANYDDKIHRRVVQEKEVESRMHLALAHNEFLVYLQPKVELKTKKIVGAEALVRWQTRDNILVPPGEFIPIFERNGFIHQLDFYVYDKVFAQLRTWIDEGKEVVPISVNISRVHLEDKHFVMRMTKLSESFGISPKLIELEITESAFFDETQVLIQVIEELKQIGFTLSIDDFGSGYSSLNLLRHLQIDVLKLDKGFFDKEHITDKEHVVLTNVIRMTRELGMQVLSEGVETIEQVDYLTEIGCDMAQGYYFARPMPMHDFEQRMWSENAVIKKT